MSALAAEAIARLSPEQAARLVASLPGDVALSIDGHFPEWAHEAQKPPPGDWRTWIIKAGRGFGKTRAGAEWVAAQARADPHARIALIAATLDDARAIMVEGESGLLAVAGDEIAAWRPSLRLIRFTSGAEARLFSGAHPAQLRGPQHHIAWCDELAKWRHPRETWDMLQLGLRLGAHPRTLVTTTPRPGRMLEDIMAQLGTITTSGGTRANIYLSPAFVESVYGLYKGTRLEAQELEGELLPESGMALWTAEMIERARLFPLPPTASRRAPPSPARGEGLSHISHHTPPSPLAGVSGRSSPGRTEDRRGLSSPETGRLAAGERGEGGVRYTRLHIGVDPPVEDGTCGIVACGRTADGIGHVIADHSVTARSPEGWARAVADAVRIHEAATGLSVKVIAERNQGGQMVEANLRAANASLRVKLVYAREGKVARAEPIAHMFEAGRVRLAGTFPELEAELRQFRTGPGETHRRWHRADGRAGSPDHADAMVWALTELMLGVETPEPRIRVL